LTQDRTHAYAYDANGNLIEKRRLRDGRVTAYTYDAEDRLIQVLTPRTEVTFQYDPLGRRTAKRVLRWHDEDGDQEPDPDEEGTPHVTHYLYDQEDILATFNDAGREMARYTHGPGIDEPLAAVRRHHTRFFHADVLGSVIALTGSHGHPIRHYRYSAFGIPEDHRWDSQPYRFTGREWDRETGIYYYRARYYDPTRARFVTEDPIGLVGGINLYGYALNNPLLYTDPDGRLLWFSPFALKAIAWAVAGSMIAVEILPPLICAATGHCDDHAALPPHLPEAEGPVEVQDPLKGESTPNSCPAPGTASGGNRPPPPRPVPVRPPSRGGGERPVRR
jgi:RHS repeat-associated protein